MNMNIIIAHNNLMERGWTKFTRHNPMGESCLLGAFEPTNKDDSAEVIAPKELKIISDIIRNKYLERIQHPNIDNFAIAEFNNHDATTFDDILEVLRLAHENMLHS